MKRRKMPSHEAVKRRFVIFLILAAILVVAAIFAPMLAPNDPYATDASAIRVSPCKQFPFGTDKFGRCVLSRVLYGARTSIFSSFALVAVSFMGGTTIGMLCGWYGGVLDEIFMRLADILLAFPQMVLAIAVAGILGGSLVNAMIAMGISGWTLYARMARSAVMSLRNESFVVAARFSGVPTHRLLLRHLLPNIAGPLLVNAATQIGAMMVGIAGLSFLGIGVTPPAAEWGSMINEARAYMQLAPWVVLYPSLAIVVTIMVFNFLGDALRDVVDIGGQYGK